MINFTKKYAPKNFDDIIGQKHLVAKDAPLRKLCEQETLRHTFFYGPAGCGKTTLSRIIALSMGLDFYELNATSLKVEDLRVVLNRYKNTLQKPLIFIDEIHRLSKNQQEVLLPYMQEDSLVLLGASTQSPYHTLTDALRSRSLIFEMHKISIEDLNELLNRVVDSEGIKIDDDANEYLLYSSGGDARAMLNLLELSSSIEECITLKTLKSLRANALGSGSFESSTHYNLTSALIKSIRGSDANASLYYLAKLIDSHESVDFIARRLVILASEDIGLANPNALIVANSAMQSILHIGYPEARIILANATIYLATSPKSNSAYKAIDKALDMIRNGLDLGIVEHITQNSLTYKNPHDFGGYIKERYLSEDISFINFKNVGYERKIKEFLEQLREL